MKQSCKQSLVYDNRTVHVSDQILKRNTHSVGDTFAFDEYAYLCYLSKNDCLLTATFSLPKGRQMSVKLEMK